MSQMIQSPAAAVAVVVTGAILLALALVAGAIAWRRWSNERDAERHTGRPEVLPFPRRRIP